MTTGFHALRNRRRVREVVLYAFDLIRHDGEGLRNLPLIDRKRRLASLSAYPSGARSSSLSI